MSHTKLAIIALAVIAGLAVVLCIYLLIKVFLLSERVRSLEGARKYGYNGNTKPDPHYLATTVVQSKQVCSYINEQVDKSMEKFLRKPSTLSFIAQYVNGQIRLQGKDTTKVAVDNKPINQAPTVQVPVQEEKPVSQPDFLKAPTPTKQEIAIRVFYVSGLDEKDDKTFCDVSEQPTDETIFKFSQISNSKSSYTIYEGAFAKVLKDDSFLTGACQIARMGNNKVVVTEKGVAELTSDNKWVVITPAKVRFE